MSELILSDITEMGPGYCVIGVERVAQDSYRSIRPLPPRGYAWNKPFRYERGNGVRYVPAPTVASPPHIEDQNTFGLSAAGRSVRETELVGLLKSAEMSIGLEELFGCELHTDIHGGNAWADPRAATRSICGCQYGNSRFLVFEDPGRVTLRAKLVLPSGETLNSLPVVDREWRGFVNDLMAQPSKSRVRLDPDRFFNRSIRPQLMQAPHHFARIGLARANKNENKCWLMLDSLFPQPNAAWLNGA
jgi:hypothetical protein